MPNVLVNVDVNDSCQLTAGEAIHQRPIIVNSRQSPHIGPDFRGPFEKPNPGPTPTIEVKQEWTSMKIHVQRDLLADVATGVLQILGSFNPKTLTGAEAALQAIISAKNEILNLILPATWSIKQDWSFSFDVQGAHTGVVQPTILATAWKNDNYFTWRVRCQTALNGANSEGEDRGSATETGLRNVQLSPEPVFSAAITPGSNTVTQTIIIDVHFEGYEKEFEAALAMLQEAADFLARKIEEIGDWFDERINEIMGDDSTTADEKVRKEQDARAEQQRREEQAKNRAATQADRAKPDGRSAVERLRTHQSYLDFDYSRVKVMCVNGTVAQNQSQLDSNISQYEKSAKESKRNSLLVEFLDVLGRHGTQELGVSAGRIVVGSEQQKFLRWAAKEVLSHELNVRELVARQALEEEDPSTRG